MDKRDSLVFYRSFYEALKEVDNDTKAQVYDAIFEYSLNFTEVKLQGLSRALFTLIKPQLDANNQRFNNGKKGGRPKKNETKEKPNNNQNETKTKPNNNQTITKAKPNVNVNDNVNNISFVPQSETSLLIDLKYSEDLPQYEKVALAFFNLIRKNLKDNGQVNFIKFDKSKTETWVKTIKLMYEVDKRTQEEFYKVYDFLELQTEAASFWRKTIESMNSLRKHFDKLIIQSNSTDTKKPYKHENKLNI